MNNSLLAATEKLPAGKTKTRNLNGISLQSEKDALRLYMDISPVIFLVLDKKGKVQLINKKGCEMLGCADENEIIGKSWFTHFAPPGKGKKYSRIFSRVIESNIDVESHGDREAPLIRKNGSASLIKWSYAVIRNGQGKPAGILCSGEDITDKKALEAKFLNAMLEGQELERKRLATELHDGLAVLLSTAKVNLGAIEAADGMSDKKKKKLLDNSIALLSTALSEIRTITLDLSPVVLQDFGLVSALKDLCQKLNRTHRLKLRLHSFGITKRLPPHFETALYRIAQELIHNAVKHSKGDKISLQLFRQGSTLTLMVEDNGTGFDIIGLFDHAGRGLKNIRSRVKNLHGFFHVDSSRGNGTVAVIEIPLKT